MGLEKSAVELSSSEQHATLSAKIKALQSANSGLSTELKASEGLVSELRTNSLYLVEQLQRTEEHLMDEMAKLVSEQGVECDQCSKFRSELTQLSDMLCRLEDQHPIWTSADDLVSLFLEKDTKINCLQADIEELLAHMSTQQSEWRSKYMHLFI